MKISPYRSGEPRFGRKSYQFDNSVKTTKLTPEELELYKSGKKTIDEILKEREREDLARGPSLPITIEEFVSLELKGLKMTQIAQLKGVTEKQLHHWKYNRKEKIEEYKQQMLKKAQEIQKNAAVNQPIPKTEKTHFEEKLIVKQDEKDNVQADEWDYKELYQDMVDENNRLREERDTANERIHELESKIDQLNRENEHLKTEFEHALKIKDETIEENTRLINEINSRQMDVKRLEERSVFLIRERELIRKEVEALRQFAHIKLSRDLMKT